ncbi:unnamed protein product [Symbiodinium necroappetens]|uniref:Carbohydrate kinase PfkB domain-containing protein n=2 Tax=Symbiodinium TaxID=2949 RepID=A0A812W9N4_9DINO|nr:unnamed protein product [Symbiodinium necroappetens]
MRRCTTWTSQLARASAVFLSTECLLRDKHRPSKSLPSKTTSCQQRPSCVAMTGDIFIDIVAPVKKLPMWDSDVEAESVKMLPGGSALNQGRHLHALGTRVRFFGAVGNDTLGQSLVQQVAGQGFPTETIKMFSNLPSSVCMVLSGPSDRAFVSCYSTTDAFTTRDLQEQADHLDGCTHFHLGGYFNMKGLQSRDFTEFVRSLKSRLSMTISMNTQCDAAGHWCGEGNHLEEFLPSVDLLFVNISEGEHLCSALCHEGDRSIHALCKRFPNTTVVVTQGEHGCTVYRHGMHAIYVPTKPAVRIVDATGCGDAFIAGFLSSWLAQSAAPNTDAEHKALIEACGRGHAVASVCLAREGACVEPVRPRDLE